MPVPARAMDSARRRNRLVPGSGTKRVVLAHYARNDRLAADDPCQAAPRHLGNRLVGSLHCCLISQTAYDENTAWYQQAEIELPGVASHVPTR